MQTSELQAISSALRAARISKEPIDPPTQQWTNLNPDSAFEFQKITVEEAKFIKPYVELEPAFVLKDSLKGPNVTIADVINAIAYAIPAIEIIDSRVKDWAIELPDTLADNSSTGAVILGGIPRRVTDLALSKIRGTMRFNGQEIMSGNTRNVLGNPLSAVAWLANKLVKSDVKFTAGQIFLPGSYLQALPMDKAGSWSCTFDGWGSIEFDVV
ncbi:hypothetical protein Ct61P_01793 [Colletotrichum tofieldiae]|nr:hypothetical protein Ct61P_01793 [Colletotrichum tofieldiae]